MGDLFYFVLCRNKNHADIKIKKFGAGISIPDYNCEAIVDLCIPPGEVHTHSLFFTPVMKDVGKIIQVTWCLLHFVL